MPSASWASLSRLGRGRLGLSWLMAGDTRLRRRYGEYLLHAPVVGDQFDAARIEAIGRMLTRCPFPMVELVFETMGLLVIAGAIAAGPGSLAAVLDPRLQDGVTGLVGILLAVVPLRPAGRRRLRRVFWFYGRR